MSNHALWKGIVAGSVAGLAGTLAMTQFQNLWSKASEKMKAKNESASGSGTSVQESADQNSQSQKPPNQKFESQKLQNNEDATMKAAGKLAEITGRTLTHEQKKKLGPIVHYAFGAGMGTVYGMIIEAGPRNVRRHDLLSGIGLGSVLFAGADEIAVPALGLSGKPWESPMSSHLYALASHMVYGVTTGAVRRAVRAVL